ncbi:hypothetical protein LCGC14_2539010, partial [marine sediment metagenome]
NRAKNRWHQEVISNRHGVYGQGADTDKGKEPPRQDLYH